MLLNSIFEVPVVCLSTERLRPASQRRPSDIPPWPSRVGIKPTYQCTCGLLKGQRMGIDATTLEANAAMRSIVRRDTGETYEESCVD